ncbi:hypothetical protein MKK67_10635 [Methylobacterium sp. J-072]|uniref:hypothetical protein n=1 Tax=Methylobacterium sp. J-072 TaxID=2836651 RepID=UPI001FB8ED32|nr:hypothetical protein [Methylobacterium sp. J-072]MCJ2092952.1 hypothetical protein [Methylobacterium sp. J-072]
MKQIEAIIVWTPARWAGLKPETAGQIAVVPATDNASVSKHYVMRAGADPSGLATLSEEGRIARLFIDFQTIVTRDGIDPQAAHRAFLAIEEYRLHLAPDTEGAQFRDSPEEASSVGIERQRA